eukprot:COSAG05_NODE_1580_length_4493_cov_8.126309_2_plen_286_part_00
MTKTQLVIRTLAISAFTKVSSLAEQYEPTDDEQDTAELVKYYEEEVPVAKAVESIINQIVEEAGVPDEVSKQSRADAQENCNSVRSPAPNVATADTAQFSDVVDSLVHDASRWESKYTKMRKKIKPDDGVLVSFWVQMKFAGAEHIMCNYMKVQVLHEPDSKTQPRLKLSLARRRGTNFPCRILSQCQRYLHDEITYLEYGEYELDIARVNPDEVDNIDPYVRLRSRSWQGPVSARVVCWKTRQRISIRLHVLRVARQWQKWPHTSRRCWWESHRGPPWRLIKRY